MKKVFSKQNLMPTAVLLIICLVSTVLLALLNKFTAPVVAEAEREAIVESLRVVMPGGEFGDPEELSDSAPDTVTAVYRDVNGKGHVVTVVTQGYGGDIAVTVGVDPDGKIIKTVVTKQSESHGKAGMDSYTDRFTGLDADGVEAAELFSGATISSTAIKGAVTDALFALGFGDGADNSDDVGRSDSELLDIIAQNDSASVYEKVDISGAEPTVKKVFKATDGDKYAVYVITSTQHVAVETEAIVFIGADETISNVALLTWTVGHGVNYTQEYLDGFGGKNANTIGGIDLVSDATGTAEHLRDAAADALAAVSSDPVLSDKEISDIAKDMIPGSAAFERVNLSDKPSTVKKIFRDTATGGYVAYVITSTQYVAVETEGVIAIDARGRITAVKLLTWTVGHGVDYTEGYLDSFVGKTADDLTEVELVSEATGTSVNFRNAVGDAMSLITPEGAPVARILATVVLILSVGGFVAYLIIRRRYR